MYCIGVSPHHHLSITWMPALVPTLVHRTRGLQSFLNIPRIHTCANSKAINSTVDPVQPTNLIFIRQFIPTRHVYSPIHTYYRSSQGIVHLRTRPLSKSLKFRVPEVPTWNHWLRLVKREGRRNGVDMPVRTEPQSTDNRIKLPGLIGLRRLFILCFPTLGTYLVHVLHLLHCLFHL